VAADHIRRAASVGARGAQRRSSARTAYAPLRSDEELDHDAAGPVVHGEYDVNSVLGLQVGVREDEGVTGADGGWIHC
jgi:hypothetical protein